MQIWTSKLTAQDISTANTAVKANGPLIRSQAALIAGMLGLKLGTVQAYFSPSNKRGLLLKSYVGMRPCAINPNAETGLKRRVFLGIMLEGDGGLSRDPLYTGKTTRYAKTFATLEECVLYQEDVIGGAWDTGIGFRLSKAWVHLMIQRADGTFEDWQVIVIYNGLGAADESDPAEPFAAFTLDGEIDPLAAS